MKRKLPAGLTSFKTRVFIQDTSRSDGGGLTGLVYNSSGLNMYYFRDGDSSPTQVSLVDATVGTYTSGGFKEISSDNMPGVYELGIPNAAMATGVRDVEIMLKGATNMAPVLMEIELDSVNYFNSTNFGLGALPSYNIGASGGLPTVGTGSGQIFTSSGMIKLGPFGLDAIPTTAPTGLASTYREMQVQAWRRDFKRVTKDATTIKTYADDNTTVLTSQYYTSSGSNDDVNAAS